MAGDPVVRQIMLIDAPAVLGWQRWRELDEQGPLGVIRDALGYAAATGRIEHLTWTRSLISRWPPPTRSP